MNSPRSGFRRAAVASWTLAGLGVAGVAGASALAYAGTVKPAVEEAPIAVAPGDAQQQAAPAAPATPAASAMTDPPTAPAGAPAAAPADIPTRPYVPPPAQVPPAQVPAAQVYVSPQAPAYVPPTTKAYAPPPAPAYTASPVAAQQAQAPAPQSPSGGFPIRKSHTPVGGGGSSSGNKFSPAHTASRGS